MRAFLVFLGIVWCLVLFNSYILSHSSKGYPDKLDYCEHYLGGEIGGSRYGVTYIVDGDTLRGVLDTGSDITTVIGKQYENRDDLLPKSIIQNADDSILQWHELKTKDFIWGDVYLSGMIVTVNDGTSKPSRGGGAVIGRKVLTNSIVQFDHENNLLRLSHNRDKIKIKGVEISCRFDKKDRIYIPISLSNGVLMDFLLDTGFEGELSVNVGSCRELSSPRESLHWKIGDKQRFESKSISLCDIALGGKIYPNTRILFSQAGGALLGTQFLRRFRTVTIDYIKKKLYFELPEEFPVPNVGNISFRKDTVDVVPLDYLAHILQYYNTYGFKIGYHDEVYHITEIERELEETKDIQLGDTLVGVNGKVFDYRWLNSLKKLTEVTLWTDRREQDVELNYALIQTNNATFYFLKQGKPYLQKLQRKQYLQTTPPFGYSYIPKPIKLGGISLVLYPDNNTRKLSVHIPWAPLIGGRVIEVDGVDDKGNNVSLSNRPPKRGMR